MKLAFYAAEKKKEKALVRSLAAGALLHGDEVVEMEEFDGVIPEGFEAIACVGVKGRSRDVLNAAKSQGRGIVYIDKGYFRYLSSGERGHWRVSIGGYQPIDFVRDERCPRNRWKRLGIPLSGRRSSGAYIILAGKSLKYHLFNGLPHPTEYAKSLIKEIRKYTSMPILYRPKPSWGEAEPIEGTVYSPADQRLSGLLPTAHVLVTHGSAASLEALVFGVPSIVLGEDVGALVSGKELAAVAEPFFPDKDARERFLFNLAYCQWTEEEMISGEAWLHIREQLDKRLT